MLKVQVIKTEENRGALELQNEKDHKQDKGYFEVNKVASMAEKEEANARLVGDYKNMKISMPRIEKCDGLERGQ